MQRLRTARLLARLVLAWLALVIGVATAAPLVQPQSLEMICSGGVMKPVLLVDGEESQPQATAGLDCPLCAAVAPPPAVLAFAEPQPLGRALQSIPSAHIAALASAALPARGPPAHS
jgi:hypothetical protein